MHCENNKKMTRSRMANEVVTESGPGIPAWTEQVSVAPSTAIQVTPSSAVSASFTQQMTTSVPDFTEFCSDSTSDEDNIDTIKSQLTSLAAKQERRREQNKMAARRSRKRLQDRGDELLKESQELSSENTALQEEIRRLTAQQQEMMLLLQSHQCALTVPSNEASNMCNTSALCAEDLLEMCPTSSDNAGMLTDSSSMFTGEEAMELMLMDDFDLKQLETCGLLQNPSGHLTDPA